jgi:hypothetical protein
MNKVRSAKGMSKKKFTAGLIVRIFRKAEVLPGQVPGMPYAKAKEGCRSMEKCLSFRSPEQGGQLSPAGSPLLAFRFR